MYQRGFFFPERMFLVVDLLWTISHSPASRATYGRWVLLTSDRAAFRFVVIIIAWLRETVLLEIGVTLRCWFFALFSWDKYTLSTLLMWT